MSDPWRSTEPTTVPPVSRSQNRADRRRHRGRRRTAWAVAVGAVLLGAATSFAAHRLHLVDTGASTPPVEPSAPPPVGALDLARPLAPVTSHLGGGSMSVALLDERTRKWAAYGDDFFDTASIVKVDILSALLLQAQDARRELTTRERELATAMVENSDNDAATTLWAAIGRAGGLDKANERLGLKQTRGGEGTVWGLTRTTAADQVRLLQSVFGRASPLDAASRSTVRHLMSHIATDQDWGVSAAADTGTSAALKNGWLQRSQTSLWDVNSIGRIEKNGRTFYVAVLMNGAGTERHGIGLVEQAARAAATSFAKSLDRGATS
ncbi:serine hydrolase [Streptomyces sp. NPDC059224]|uniref:serine hydrolase n=1 Tax=Streptomyces sp. NPDC059224 TaxID=3346775 RepID=UPI0036A6BD24